jgi:hypothetical protein
MFPNRMFKKINTKTRQLLHFPPNHWRNYGQAIHQKEWWEGAVIAYFKTINPSFKEGDIFIKEYACHHLLLMHRVFSVTFILKKKDIVETLDFILN